ncbi:hypothetical protein M514_08581 [Trichuris suis]|uniref:Uncharacterized protein n=1 Tax=Trichuris suis TaxID=68888 RepID=A0A085N1W8_9BILA|nr:hypothetical protein M514_08581 [Trichuris suis]
MERMECFTIKTDQRSVSFVFNRRHRSKIKIDKVFRGRTELSCLDFDIIHRPGKDNVPPDVFSRVAYGLVVHDGSQLKFLHEGLCRLESLKRPLIKATQPFERLNLDFKGPLPGDSLSIPPLALRRVLYIPLCLPVL